MKKNALKALTLSFCLILLSAVVLNSCREEFIAANHHREKNITIKRLTKKDLDTNPKLSGKLSKLNALPSVNGVAYRTYTNAQNGFTVETDEFVFIENGDGVKTYTFKIDRPNTSENAPLENFVLTEISGDSLKAEIWKYNQVILNKQNPTVNDAKNYITISSIGNIGSSEIFYKANPCYGTVPNVVFEEPRNCPCEGHNYASIGDCKCSVKPTQGSYKIVYTTEFLCSGSGGGGGSGTANPGDGGSGGPGGTTIPFPGGDDEPDLGDAPPSKTICETMKEDTENTAVKNAIENLKTKTTEKEKEYAYEINRTYSYATQKYTFSLNYIDGNSYSTDVSYGDAIKGTAHSHPINGVAVPSVGDVMWLKRCKEEIKFSNEAAYNIVVSANPASPNDTSTAIVYAIATDDHTTISAKVDEMLSRSDLADKTYEEKRKALLKEEGEYYKDLQNNIPALEKKFLEKFSSFGLSLLKFNNSTNKWEKLTLENDTVTPKPCE